MGQRVTVKEAEAAVGKGNLETPMTATGGTALGSSTQTRSPGAVGYPLRGPMCIAGHQLNSPGLYDMHTYRYALHLWVEVLSLIRCLVFLLCVLFQSYLFGLTKSLNFNRLLQT